MRPLVVPGFWTLSLPVRACSAVIPARPPLFFIANSYAIFPVHRTAGCMAYNLVGVLGHTISVPTCGRAATRLRCPMVLLVNVNLPATHPYRAVPRQPVFHLSIPPSWILHVNATVSHRSLTIPPSPPASPSALR